MTTETKEKSKIDKKKTEIEEWLEEVNSENPHHHKVLAKCRNIKDYETFYRLSLVCKDDNSITEVFESLKMPKDGPCIARLIEKLEVHWKKEQSGE